MNGDIYTKDITETHRHLLEGAMPRGAAERCRVTFRAIPEELDPADQGYPDENVERITDALGRGLAHAWFTAEVSVGIAGIFEGTATLGCCSYRSFDDFLSGDGYDSDLVVEAGRQALVMLEEAEQVIKEVRGS